MRLVCPNCDAEYEIARTAIPRSGRQVECASCGHGWFQAFADLRIEEVAQKGPDEATEPPAQSTPPRPIDDAVLEVLRQEAEREVKARQAEAGRSGLEIQTEMPLSANDAGAAHLRSLKAAGDFPSAPQEIRTRRDLLPAIDEVNAALQEAPEARGQAETVAPVSKVRPSALARAFLFVILLCVILLAVYVFAPLIAQKVPSLSAACADYVAAVDRGMLWMQDHFRRAVDWLQSVSRGLAG
jgi:predicted Zn finger-like uncharacterized protein